MRECGCRETLYDSGQVVRVDTCPVCLPVGAITWIIEHGRQLDLFPTGDEKDAPPAGRLEIESKVGTFGEKEGEIL